MKRLTIGTLMGEHPVKAGEMLRGNVQTKPRLRFQAILYLVGDIQYASKLMSDMDLWAKDNDGVVDVANKNWIIQQADPIIDGDVIPPDQHLKAMQKMIDGHRTSRLEKAQDSAVNLSLALDQRVLDGQANALDAKYAGDKLGWLWRANPPSTKQQTMSVGNLVINAGQPPRIKKPMRIDKRDTKRLAEVIDAEVKVIG